MAGKKRKPRRRSNPRQASQFVHEEMRHRGRRSKKQAIAIGLSRARRAGVKVPTPNPNGAYSPPPWRAMQRGDHWQITDARGQIVLSIYKGLIPIAANLKLILAAPEMFESLGGRQVRSNPNGATRIYPEVYRIVARKNPRGGDHPCDADCKRGNHIYEHTFNGRRRPSLWGYPDGSLVIR
jgi:Family of unknown function (DUF6496)